MPRPIPPALAVTLTALRAAHGWPQGELAQATGAGKNDLSEMERGRKPLSREKLEELVAPMGAGAEAIDLTLAWLAALYEEVPAAAGSPFELSAPERRRIKAIAVAAGQSAFAAAASRVARSRWLARARRDRARARRSWESLRRCEPPQQRLLVEGTAEHRSWALCELICDQSVGAAPKDAARALALAELALLVAERTEGSEAWRARLQGYAWAFAGNARRVGSDLDGAGRAFERSRALWAAGAGADPGVLDASRVPDLEASFLRACRQFGEALALLDRALALSPGPARTAHILLNRSSICEQRGDREGTIEALRRAAPLVDGAREPRQACVLRFNLAVNLCHLGRHAEAAPRVAEARQLAIGLRNELDLVRVLWLEARVAGGLGNRGEAIAALRQVRRAFAERDMTYDAALATLDLAVLLLEENANSEARELAGKMVAIFEGLEVHREALAAVRVFWQATRQETATAELGRRLLRFLERARHDPELRFDPGALEEPGQPAPGRR
jgi:tetratricopeptide (TPR) repeat protein